MQVKIKRDKNNEFEKATLELDCIEFTKIKLALLHYKKELEKLDMTDKSYQIENIIKKLK